MIWVIVAVIVGVAFVWLVTAPPADSVATRASAIGALRSAVERAATYSPPPTAGDEVDEDHHNVHIIGTIARPDHDGMAPAA